MLYEIFNHVDQHDIFNNIKFKNLIIINNQLSLKFITIMK